MIDYTRRTWVDIDLEAISHNLSVIRKTVGNSEIMCIVKADAYGHGVEKIAQEYQSLGIRWFGVSNIEEAVELRRCGITGDILILGYNPIQCSGLLYEYGITQAVFSEEYAAGLSKAAVDLGIKVKCHLKVDTGMGRLGFNCRNNDYISGQVETCERVHKLEGLDIVGIFTHFAVADEGENGEIFTRNQFEHFLTVIKLLGGRGIEYRWRHCCNSAGALAYPDMSLDMVRPGIILYGLAPSSYMRGKYPLRPAMSLRSVISMVKELEAGASVSYGRKFIAERPAVVATAPIGYADGYPRILSGCQDFLINGKRAPILGRVCMDQIMLDVTGIPGVSEGDQVTAFGYDHGELLSVDELADKTDTINYEIVCRMTRRVPRIYYRDGVAVGQTDYII